MTESLYPFKILEAIQANGGRPLLVGGAVRDIFMGATKVKDFDFEIHNMSLEDLQKTLSTLGEVDLVGKAFGVLKLHNLQNVDFSVPRKDNRIGIGHKGFSVQVDTKMGIKEASKRRDLTINSMAYDPFTEELLDPFNGLDDLKKGVLKATDLDTFLEDPLRALRVAQFISRFEMTPDQELLNLCSSASLKDLPGERILVEFEKLLLGKKPSRGLDFLKTTGLIRTFPVLNALIGCPQDPIWHPEGDVWTHTLLATDVARTLSDDLIVLFGTLLHDTGKPLTTIEEEGRIRSRGHEEGGIAPSKAFLNDLKAPKELIDKVSILVAHHLAPAHFVPDEAHKGKRAKAGLSAYRRLSRTLDAKGTNLETLYLVSKADHLGRTTKDALLGQFPSGDEFLRVARGIKVSKVPEAPAVMGRHLISRGIKPGIEMGNLLRQCREIQDETGEHDPEVILKKVLV